MCLVYKKTKLNSKILFLMVVISFLSYERTIYKNFYQLMIFSVFFIGFNVSIWNIGDKKKYRLIYMNLKNNIPVHIFSILIVLSSLMASVKYVMFSISDFISVILTIASLYIFYLFLPILINEDIDDNIERIIKLITIFSAVSIIIAICGNFMGYGPTHYNRIASILFDPNYFGTLASIGFILSIKRRNKFKIMAIINFMALFLSGSRAAMLSLLFVIIVFFFYNKRVSYKDIFKLFLLVIVLYYALRIMVNINFFRIYQGLNSRDFLWRLSFRLILKEPVWGYGYGSVGELLRGMGATNASSHNAYLDFILTYGIPAFLMYFYIILKAFFIGVKNKIPQEITKSILFLLITANSISINLGGLGALSLLLTLFLGVSNMRCYRRLNVTED